MTACQRCHTDPVVGTATINGQPHCHDPDQRPSCYDLAMHDRHLTMRPSTTTKRSTPVTDTIAKLAAKKLDAETGISDEDARQLYLKPGSRRIAIVELEAFETTDSIDDKHVVRVRATHLELIPQGKPEDTARDWSKAIYKARQPAPLDPEFGEETADDVANRAQALVDDGQLVTTS